jgi:hypothetical protein
MEAKCGTGHGAAKCGVSLPPPTTGGAPFVQRVPWKSQSIACTGQSTSWIKVILGTGTRCWGEGIGPAGADREELLNAIAAQHPALVEHYGHIDWPHKRKTKGDNDEQNR